MKQRSLYEILSAVKSSRTFTEVANKLYISQPYISEVIHNVENKYQTRIIKRKPLPIELTDAGEILLSAMGQMIEVENKLDHDIAPYSKQKNSAVKIGFHQPWTIAYGADFMLKLQKKFPTIRFEVIELTSDIGEQKLLNGDIDIFVGREFHQDKLITKLVMKEPLALIVPPSSTAYKNNFTSHAISKEELGALNNSDFVCMTDDSFYQRMINHMLQDNGIHQNVAMKFSNIIAAAKAATNGLGCNVTITNVVDQFIDTSSCNVYQIPNWLLELNLGLAYKTNATKLIHNIGDELASILKQYH